MVRGGLFLILFFPVHWCLADDIYIRLRPEVTLEHSNIYLRDIASVTTSSDDHQKIEKLLAEQIAKMGIHESTMRLSRHDVESIISKHRPDLRESIIFGGAESVSVQGRQAVSLAPEMDSLATWVMQRVGPQLGAVELTVMTKNTEFHDVPMGAVEKRPLFEQTRRSGQDIHIPILVSVDGRVYAKPVLHFRLQPIHGAAALDRTVFPLVSASHATTKIASSLTGAAMDGVTHTDDSDLPGKKSFLITKNQLVRIVVQDGVIRIESDGISLANANVGDEVKVRRGDNPDVLVGHVSGPNTVVVGDDQDV